jgi:hypothetical protein
MSALLWKRTKRPRRSRSTREVALPMTAPRMRNHKPDFLLVIVFIRLRRCRPCVACQSPSSVGNWQSFRCTPDRWRGACNSHSHPHRRFRLIEEGHSARNSARQSSQCKGDGSHRLDPVPRVVGRACHGYRHAREPSETHCNGRNEILGRGRRRSRRSELRNGPCRARTSLSSDHRHSQPARVRPDRHGLARPARGVCDPARQRNRQSANA